MFDTIKQYLKSKTIRVAILGAIIPALDQLGPAGFSGFMSPHAYVVFAAVWPIVMAVMRSISTDSIKDK